MLQGAALSLISLLILVTAILSPSEFLLFYCIDKILTLSPGPSYIMPGQEFALGPKRTKQDSPKNLKLVPKMNMVEADFRTTLFYSFLRPDLLICF